MPQSDDTTIEQTATETPEIEELSDEALGCKADIECPLFESYPFRRHQCPLSGAKRTL